MSGTILTYHFIQISHSSRSQLLAVLLEGSDFSAHPFSEKKTLLLLLHVVVIIIIIIIIICLWLTMSSFKNLSVYFGIVDIKPFLLLDVTHFSFYIDS